MQIIRYVKHRSLNYLPGRYGRQIKQVEHACVDLDRKEWEKQVNTKYSCLTK